MLAVRIAFVVTLLACAGGAQAEDSPPSQPPRPPQPPGAKAPAAPCPLPEPTPGPAPAPAPWPEPAPSPALARTRALRATLPEPTGTFLFEADLCGLGHRLGSVSVSAEPGTYHDKPCWVVSERTVREAGKGRVVSELTAFLAPDLSLLRGETYYKAPSGGAVTSFGWRDGVLEVVEQGDGGASRSAAPSVPASATVGMFALLTLLKALPADGEKDWHLEAFDARFAFGDDKGQPLPTDLADLALTVEGPSTLTEGALYLLGRPTHAVRARAGWGRELVVHLDPATRAPRGVVGVVPGMHLLPARSQAVAPRPTPTWFDAVGQPPKGPFEAFVTFGRGYHLPKRELLEQAFHWPSMREAEIASGQYKDDVALEKVRDDWVAEFERMSKHRTEGDCDDLIIQLMASATITLGEDGSLTIDTLPAFGDHAYTMAERDGRWWIVKVD
jgi:hypothetical protein